MQSFIYLRNGAEHVIPLPSARAELLPGIYWGEPCALFTPAYWYTQYLMSDPVSDPRFFRIGQTFAEEVTVALLGGHGIPAEIGLAAFRRLKDGGFIEQLCTDRRALEDRLRAPLSIGQKQFTYRFWQKKAFYLASAYRALATTTFSVGDALKLRNELTALEGVGPKTASWIVRNWLGSNEVAILDIHIIRAGMLAGVFDQNDNVSRDYFRMEAKFLLFADALGVPTSTLDSLIWAMMRSTPRLIKRLLDQLFADDSHRMNLVAPNQSPTA